MAAYYFGEFIYYPEERCLLRGKEKVFLRPQTAKLLVLFLENPGRLISHSEIIETLWGQRVLDFDNGIRVAIAKLRALLGGGRISQTIIQNEPSLGYRFVLPISGGSKEKFPFKKEGLFLNLFRVGPWKRTFGFGLGAIALIFLIGVQFTSFPEFFARHVEWESKTHEATLALIPLMEMEDFKTKREGLDQLLAQFPDFAPGYYEKARLLLFYGSWEDSKASLSLLQKAISLQPKISEYHALQAKAFWMIERNFEAAEDSYRKAIELDPQAVNNRLLLAWTLLINNHPGKALQELETARTIDAMAVSARSDVFWLYLNTKNLDKAERACRELEQKTETTLRGVQCFIDLNLALNKKEIAVSLMEKYLNARGIKAESKSPIETTYWQVQLETHPQTNSRASPAPVQRAVALVQLGDLKRARKELEAANKNGNYFSPLVNFIPGLKQVD